MDRVYIFDAVGICEESGHEFDAACIYFSDRMEISSLDFYSDLESSLKSRDVLPDCVIIIASPIFCEQIRAHWSRDVLRESYVERGVSSGISYIKHYYFFSWCKDGLAEQFRHPETSLGACAYKIPIKEFVLQGAQSLVRHNPVLQVAPAGHLFKHPSGTRNNIFIQARELAVTEPQLCFVGRSITCVLDPKIFEGLAVVYIDSMSIYPYVREALDFIGSKARIHSFHSYEEIKKVTPPPCPHLVIISASTSGGMARDMITEQGFDEARVLTMIDKSDTARKGTVFIALSKVGDISPDADVSGYETEIELVGEHFSSKAKPPRAVTLGRPHVPPKLKKFLLQFGRQGLNSFNETMGQDVKLVSIEAGDIPGNSAFRKWLSEEIEWRTPVSIDTIISADNHASLTIARYVAELISGFRGGFSCIKPIVYGVDDLSVISEAKGVLVVSAVSRDGGVLREISRDLREFLNPRINCPRHFIAAVGLPQSRDSWIKLRQFLERNASDRLYGFSEWLVLPMGSDKKSNSWNELIMLAGRSHMSDLHFSNLSPKVINDSLEEMSTVISESFSGFLPKTNREKLALTAGFIYFGDVFGEKVDEASYTASYVAIAAAMQAARDMTDSVNQLRSTGYESVVLSPECFLRFNDNILHACILRACQKGELDYSASPAHSKMMMEFLIKVFARRESAYGAAAVEFAAALAIQKLKLKRDDHISLLESTIDLLKDTPSALLGFILMARSQVA